MYLTFVRFLAKFARAASCHGTYTHAHTRTYTQQSRIILAIWPVDRGRVRKVKRARRVCAARHARARTSERERDGEEENETDSTRYYRVARRVEGDGVRRERRHAGVAGSGDAGARETERRRDRGAAGTRQRRASIGALAVTPTMVLSLSPNGASLSRSPALGATAANTLSSPASLSDWYTLRASERFFRRELVRLVGRAARERGERGKEAEERKRQCGCCVL